MYEIKKGAAVDDPKIKSKNIKSKLNKVNNFYAYIILYYCIFLVLLLIINNNILFIKLVITTKIILFYLKNKRYYKIGFILFILKLLFVNYLPIDNIIALLKHYYYISIFVFIIDIIYLKSASYFKNNVSELESIIIVNIILTIGIFYYNISNKNRKYIALNLFITILNIKQSYINKINYNLIEYLNLEMYYVNKFVLEILIIIKKIIEYLIIID